MVLSCSGLVLIRSWCEQLVVLLIIVLLMMVMSLSGVVIGSAPGFCVHTVSQRRRSDRGDTNIYITKKKSANSIHRPLRDGTKIIKRKTLT